MPHLSRAQEETRQRIKRLAGSGLLPSELGREILNAVQCAIPSDEIALVRIDSETYLINRVLAILGGNPKGTLYWLQHVYLVNEPMEELTFPGIMSRNIRVVGLRDRPEACWGVPADIFSGVTPHQFYNAYHDIGTPPGGGLRVWFEVDGRKIAAMQMVRAEVTRPFRSTDGEYLFMLAPLIGRALGIAFAREEALMGSNTEMMAVGMLAIDAIGKITLQSRSVDEWFEVLTDPGSVHGDGIGPSGIPVSVWSVVAGLKANGGKGRLHASLRVPTRFGPVRVEASPSGEDGTIAVVLLPDRRISPLELPQSWQLTPQERGVLSLVARGLKNRQIAEALVVSEHTVESHLAHAYEKLSVNSRTQFLARLFRDAYWPVQSTD